MRFGLPFAPHVQQSQLVRRIGVLHYFTEHDPESQLHIAAFLTQLKKLGWTTGKNLQIDYRSTGGVDGRVHQCAAELIDLAPDVIIAVGNAHVGALRQITHAIPIVFVQVVDAVGSGLRV